MTWTELITIITKTPLDKKQIISTFYQLSPSAPEKDLADIALLYNHDAENDFCIRLTWQGKIPESGKSFIGSQIAKTFSKKGQTHHTVWRRETSLFLINYFAGNEK